MIDLADLLQQPGVSEAMLSVLLALVALLVAFLGMLTRKLNAVTHQVVNDHGTGGGKEDNLRDQVDRIEKSLLAGQMRTDKQLEEMHKVLTQEVEDRQALEKRSQYEHARFWKVLDEGHARCMLLHSNTSGTPPTLL